MSADTALLLCMVEHQVMITYVTQCAHPCSHPQSPTCGPLLAPASFPVRVPLASPTAETPKGIVYKRAATHEAALPKRSKAPGHVSTTLKDLGRAAHNSTLRYQVRDCVSVSVGRACVCAARGLAWVHCAGQAPPTTVQCTGLGAFHFPCDPIPLPRYPCAHPAGHQVDAGMPQPSTPASHTSPAALGLVNQETSDLSRDMACVLLWA
jgi:hypothetical protein